MNRRRSKRNQQNRQNRPNLNQMYRNDREGRLQYRTQERGIVGYNRVFATEGTNVITCFY